MRLGRSLVITWVLFGTGLTAGLAEARPLSPLAQRGRQVMKKAECQRCHTITDAMARPKTVGRGLASAPTTTGCVSCHTWILDTRDKPEAIAAHSRNFPDWSRYLESIAHFKALPDLGTLMARVEPGFVRRFLDGPFDLRPHLDEAMIAVRLSAGDKDAVVAYLAELGRGAPLATTAEPQRGRVASPEQIAAGRQAFVDRGCVSCHLMGAEAFADITEEFRAAMKPAASLAPDLRFARQRLSRATMVRYIRAPQKVDPQSRMPQLSIDAPTAESLADYVLWAKVERRAVPSLRPDPTLLTRSVAFAEVQSRVLGKICVHCHMDPANNAGRGGAGHSGGLGFLGVGLNLETYEGVRAGLRRGKTRLSVLEAPAPGEEPLLIQALLRRYDEHAQAERGLPSAVAARPGMPMGLPPLSHADLALVRTWISQGAPGPAEIARR